MSLVSQKKRLMEQVLAILVSSTKVFGDPEKNQFISFHQPGFPEISVENWVITGVAFVNNNVVLVDERELHFSLWTVFDSSVLDELLEIVDTLHHKALAAAPEKSAQYSDVLKICNGPALFPVSLVFHQSEQHISVEEATLAELSPDAIRRLLLQQGAWDFDDTKPVEFSIYEQGEEEIELMSGALHPALTRVKELS